LPGATLDLVGCVACHDPHGADNVAQLRTLADYSVLYDANQPATFTGQGSSQLCAQCHHARRSVTDVTNQVLGNASGVFSTLRGPHYSPQMDMFLGTGSYEIPGFQYDRGVDGFAHKAVGNACVTCHMEVTTPHGYPLHDHTFAATLTACQSCHPGSTSFDIDSFDAGTVGGQTEIRELLASIAEELGVPEDSLSSTSWTATVTDAWKREAIYSYLFVKNDGSYGVHNPAYATSLLTNALLHLQNN